MNLQRNDAYYDLANAVSEKQQEALKYHGKTSAKKGHHRPISISEKAMIEMTLKQVRKHVLLVTARSNERYDFELSNGKKYRCNKKGIFKVFDSPSRELSCGKTLNKILKKELIKEKYKNIREAINKVGSQHSPQFDCFQFARKVMWSSP